MDVLKGVKFESSKNASFARIALRCRFWLPIGGFILSLCFLAYTFASFFFLPSLLSGCLDKYNATNSKLIAATDVDKECAKIVAQALTYSDYVHMRALERRAHQAIAKDSRIKCLNSTDVGALPLLVAFQLNNNTHVVFNPVLSSTKTKQSPRLVQDADGALQHIFGFETVTIKGIDVTFSDIDMELKGDVAHCVSVSALEVEMINSERDYDGL